MSCDGPLIAFDISLSYLVLVLTHHNIKFKNSQVDPRYLPSYTWQSLPSHQNMINASGIYSMSANCFDVWWEYLKHPLQTYTLAS